MKREERRREGGGEEERKKFIPTQTKKYSKMSGPYTRGKSLKWNVGEKLEVLF